MHRHDLTKRERRILKNIAKAKKRGIRRKKQLLNQRKRRSAIVFGIAMTRPDAPGNDTLEYLALKMMIVFWPTATVSKKHRTPLDAALARTMAMLFKAGFNDNDIRKAIYPARTAIDRSLQDYHYYKSRHIKLPTEFLLSAIEHSLVHEKIPFGELMNVVRQPSYS